MHIRRISMAKYPYLFKQGNYYLYPIHIRIRENCGYPQNICLRIHIHTSLPADYQLCSVLISVWDR